MPYLQETSPSGGVKEAWHGTLRNALLTRAQADSIQPTIKELMRRHRAPGHDIADVLLGFRAAHGGSDDPLLFHYARVLLNLGAVGTNSILGALLKTSRFMKPPISDYKARKRPGLPSCEERMFNMLTQMYLAEELQVELKDAHLLLNVLAHWMQTLSAHETGRQLKLDNAYTVDANAFGMYEAVASLAITVLSNRALRGVSKLPWWGKRRPTIVTEMENFDAHVLFRTGSQLTGRLQALAGLPPYAQCGKDGRPLFQDQQILQSIQDLPVVTSRAGLFIWLNSCLSARPLTDDMAALSFLQARYSGDSQAIVIALLQATFDVLTNSLLRKESEHEVRVIRSYLCNKVPIMFSFLGGFMTASATIEACIQAAFESISMDAVPPISAGSAEGRDKLKLARREFLQAATLHGLLSEQTMSAILMEPGVSAPKTMRYSREGLAAQCTNNLGHLEHLVEELYHMTGNAGAIAGCIVDIINNLCSSKDTMTLKSVCNMLIKKIPVFDVILQYAQPAHVLLPLCTQLNEWTHDQEQTEFTPAYEEFASILLLVLAVAHRYNLGHSELGLIGHSNFVAHLLRDVAVSKKASDLTPEQNSQLSKWIEGLYAADEAGETNGIGDEVMRQCPPQAFYQLVPTLFEQSVLACKSNALPMRLFKGGLELLLEPFLLPCLVGGLSWLVEHSWEDHGDGDVLMQALDKLLRQNSASQEAKSMHKAILAIVADPLCNTLEMLITRKPNQRTEKQVTALLDILRPYRHRKRTMMCSKSELSEFASSTTGGFAGRLKVAFQEQIIWTSNIGPTPPARYTHRIFVTATQTVGVHGVLDVLLAELTEQTLIGNGAQALDVCSAMVCAPVASPSSPLSTLDGGTHAIEDELTLRDALRLRTSNVQSLLKLPAETAQALVRLRRRVESQLAVAPITQLPVPMPMQPETSDQTMAELGLTDDNNMASVGVGISLEQQGSFDPPATANFTNADIEAALNQPMIDLSDGQQQMPSLPLDQSGMAGQSQDLFADLDMDLSQPGQNADGSNQNDDDIFAGLNMDLGDDFDFS